MKVAILIFGEYRTFETAVKTWNCRFLDDVDYYMSTWDTSLGNSSTLPRHLDIPLWENTPDEDFIKSTLPNVTLEMTNADSLHYTENHDTNKMVYHWKKLYDMVMASEKQYDCVFLVRPDTYFFIHDNLFSKSKENTLYTISKVTKTTAHDIFFFGYGNIVLDFLKNVPNKIDDVHIELANYLNNNFANRLDDITPAKGITYGLLRPSAVSPYSYLNETPLQKNDKNPKFIKPEFISKLRYYNSHFNAGIMNVLLIGESCKDKFIYGNIDRLSPEAPIPIINPTTESVNIGMAGNVNKQFEELYGNIDFVTNNSVVTKTRYVDNSTNYILLRVDVGDENIEKINFDNLPNKKYDVIIFSDYDKGFLSEKNITEIIDYYKQKSNNLLTFIDTKKQFGDWIHDLDYIKVNYKEYRKNLNFINKNKWIDKKLIITRGPNGCDYNGKTYPNKEVPVKDLSGAGDTFLASLVSKYIISDDIEDSIEYANKISEMAIQKKAVSFLTRDEIYDNLKKINYEK